MYPKIVLCAAVLLLCPVAEGKPPEKPQSNSKAKQQARSEGKTEAKPVKNEEVKKEKSADLELLAIEENIVKYTNAQRAKYGLAALAIDRELMKSAREHASWMANSRRLVHTRRPVAENIAMGYPHSRSVVVGWMNSSGHRANILNRGYRRIGAAAYRTASGTIYWCQQFRR